MATTTTTTTTPAAKAVVPVAAAPAPAAAPQHTLMGVKGKPVTTKALVAWLQQYANCSQPTMASNVVVHCNSNVIKTNVPPLPFGFGKGVVNGKPVGARACIMWALVHGVPVGQLVTPKGKPLGTVTKANQHTLQAHAWYLASFGPSGNNPLDVLALLNGGFNPQLQAVQAYGYLAVIG